MHRSSVGRCSSATGNRRSSAGGSGRTSLAPARIKHDNASNVRGNRRNSGGNRTSIGSVGSTGSSKKPISRFRMQASSSARRFSASSVRGTFGHEILKETRPLSDKKYMQHEIKEIIEFLEEYNFPHPVSPKRMMSPTTKDFLEIFQFIYGFLHPDYKPAQKHEEEIIHIFKTLRYPFNISKSSLLSLGSPHAWPTVLGALHFLTNYVQYALGGDTNQLLFGNEGEIADDGFGEEVTEAEIFYKFVEDTYEEYLAGSDTFEDCESELESALKKKNLGISDLDQLSLEEERLAEELARLEQDPSQLGMLQMQEKGIQNDNEAFTKYLNELKHHHQMMEKVHEDVSLQVQEKEVELTQNEDKIRQLEFQLAKQELSALDVQRIKSEVRQLTEARDREDRNVQEIDQKIWTEEKSFAKLREVSEHKGQEFNFLARKLKLIPADAENAGGIDFELQPSYHGNPTLMADFINTIKPALQKLKTKMNDAYHEKNNEDLMEEERLDKLIEMIENKEHEFMMLEKKVQKIDQEISTLRDESKKELDSLNSRLSECEEELKILISAGDDELTLAAAEVEAYQRRAASRSAEMKEEVESYKKFVLNAATAILEHRMKMLEHFRGVAKKMKVYRDKYNQLKVPEMPDLSHLDH